MSDALNSSGIVTDAILKAGADYLMPIKQNGNPMSHNSCDRRSSIVEDQEHATKDSWNLSIL